MELADLLEYYLSCNVLRSVSAELVSVLLCFGKSKVFCSTVYFKNFLTKCSFKKGNGTLIMRKEGRRVGKCVWNGIEVSF